MLISGKFIIQELSLSLLKTEYKDHHRLGVFYRKGTVCVCCGAGKEGVRLVLNTSRNGMSVHVDVFTKEWKLMTVDHIIARAKGGSDEWENKQPMCERCNGKKSDKDISLHELQLRLQII